MEETEMSFCPSCGKPLSPGADRCAFCAPYANQNAAVAVAPASSGMSINTAGALAYIAGLITAIVFLVIDPYKSDRFVRFHAFQSLFFNLAWIGLWIAWTILGLILSAVTKGLFFFIQMPIDLLLMLGGFGLWAFLMYSASQGRTFRLPVIGALAAKQAGW
jgi:uncharacterized membrane protein